MKTPWMSIVIPAYNEATRIRATLDKLLTYFRSSGRPFEILVVDDGSQDETVPVVQRGAEPELRVVRLSPNQGKGAAVRAGVAASKGQLVLVSDADLAIPIEEFPQFEQWLEQGYAVACGSRGLPESRALSPLPIFRKRMGKLFNWMVRCLHLTEFRDTQCGFKLFRGTVARDVFARSRVNRFAYDVEALRIAERSGYRIVEVPISWRHIPESRVRPLSDAVRMFLDLLRIRLRN